MAAHSCTAMQPIVCMAQANMAAVPLVTVTGFMMQAFWTILRGRPTLHTVMETASPNSQALMGSQCTVQPSIIVSAPAYMLHLQHFSVSILDVQASCTQRWWPPMGAAALHSCALVSTFQPQL